MCQAAIKHIVVDGEQQVRPAATFCLVRCWLPAGARRPDSQTGCPLLACSALLCPALQEVPPPDRLEEEGPDLNCLDHAYFRAESDRLLCRWGRAGAWAGLVPVLGWCRILQLLQPGAGAAAMPMQQWPNTMWKYLYQPFWCKATAAP
jgi:hypothetical protein